MKYHVALIYGTGTVQCWANGHRKDTVVVEMSRDIDAMSTDIHAYLGIRDTTKAAVKADKSNMLAWINKEFGKDFKRLVVT